MANFILTANSTLVTKLCLHGIGRDSFVAVRNISACLIFFANICVNGYFRAMISCSLFSASTRNHLLAMLIPPLKFVLEQSPRFTNAPSENLHV
eukprot:TRINITY_DN13169_c0_g1_i1.p2 TRINITY_DN13169_c0_g1~~TRINITY_DN13169_c0_g1_i1.p2  ORF type:complete len:110 (+),score=7.08 TRINITY_DN13169_c0_g1_i1:49-330(+)